MLVVVRERLKRRPCFQMVHNAGAGWVMAIELHAGHKNKHICLND
jgi:hypothetical protein